LIVAATPADVHVHVHERGDRSLDGILRLIELAGGDRGLEDVLGAMCPEVAAITGADVASVYVREGGPGGDRLVLRGNVGFPRAAIGRVSLRVGEGIVGFVAECLRPVTVAIADRDAHFKPIPGLGEEHYPSFLGVPLLAGARAAGVLVLQRSQVDAFSDREVVLATALAAPLGFAVQRARAAHRRRASDRRGQAATLRGVPRAPGIALGRAAMIPTLQALSDSDVPAPIAGALDRVRRDLDRARRRLGGPGQPAIARALENLALVVEDDRFRGRVEGTCARLGLAAGLAEVARDYARVPYRVAPGDRGLQAVLAERAREVEDLCLLLHAAASDAALLPRGGVWLAERVGVFVALCAVARGAAAVAVEGAIEPEAPAVAVLRAGGVPLVTEVAGLFAWTRPHDLLIVDGDGGSVRVNPTSDWVARVRQGSAGK
jgi:phosphotransferase system, enzyme I, PtsP